MCVIEQLLDEMQLTSLYSPSELADKLSVTFGAMTQNGAEGERFMRHCGACKA